MNRSMTRVVIAVVALVVGSSALGAVAAAGALSSLMPCCQGGGQSDYQVTFTESGLPSGTNWSVSIDGYHLYGTTTSLYWDGYNGSYPYTVGTVRGYVSRPQAGDVMVIGRAQTVSVVFAPLLYDVQFTESTLPAGTPWYVALNGTAEVESTTTTLGIAEPNGVYSYVVYPPQNYPVALYNVTSGGSGQITVSGAPPTPVTVTFSQVIWTMTFKESGLPSGTEWQVDLNNTTGPGRMYNWSTTNTIPFPGLFDGQYSYWIIPVAGYSQTIINGSWTINGANKTINVTFTPA